MHADPLRAFRFAATLHGLRVVQKRHSTRYRAFERGGVMRGRELAAANAGRQLEGGLKRIGEIIDHLRYVPMTVRLAVALREYRHLRGSRVLCKDDGRPLTRQSAWGRVRRAAKAAGVPTGVHILRHSFCSFLAMRGAPGRSIQELAGHQELTMTQRYMHLSRAALGEAIRLLDAPRVLSSHGDMLETGSGDRRKANV